MHFFPELIGTTIFFILHQNILYTKVYICASILFYLCDVESGMIITYHYFPFPEYF